MPVPLTDAEVKNLGDQGYREGDTVPGKGVLLPDGTFKQDVTNLGSSSSTGLTSSAVPLPTGINLADATYDQVVGIFGQGGINAYNLQRYPNGHFNITQANLQALSNNRNKDAIAASSDSVVQQENNVTNTVKGIANPSDGTEGAQSASDKYIATVDDQIKALEARRKAEVDQINADFDAKKTATEKAQAGEIGTETTTLARIGGYLGPSASATGALLNLAAQHRSEILNLESKRQAAIQEANNAIEDKTFVLARAKVQEFKDIEKEIYDRKQNFFDNSIKIQQEADRQDTEKRLKIKDDLANLSLLDPSSVSSDKKAEIDAFYGTPGFTDKYLQVSSAAAKAKNQQDVLENQKKILDLVQAIPNGQTIKFPDGTEYTGMGKAGDITTFMQVDDSGNAHVITYDKSQQKVVGVSTVPGVGKTTKGPSTQPVPPAIKDNATAVFQIQLEQSKDKNGQYDPDTYLKLRKQLKEVYPQLVPDMDKLYLNRQYQFFSDEAIKRLREKGVYFAETALPGDNTVINNYNSSDNADTVGQ